RNPHKFVLGNEFSKRRGADNRTRASDSALRIPGVDVDCLRTMALGRSLLAGAEGIGIGFLWVSCVDRSGAILGGDHSPQSTIISWHVECADSKRRFDFAGRHSAAFS